MIVCQEGLQDVNNDNKTRDNDAPKGYEGFDKKSEIMKIVLKP